MQQYNYTGSMNEDDLEKFGFVRTVYPINRYRTKVVYVKGEMVCEFTLNSITHKIKGKEVSREEFFENAIKI